MVLIEVMVMALVVVVLVVVVITVLMVGKRGTTTINFNMLGGVCENCLGVQILIALGLIYLNIFLVGLIVVLVVVEHL